MSRDDQPGAYPPPYRSPSGPRPEGHRGGYGSGHGDPNHGYDGTPDHGYDGTPHHGYGNGRAPDGRYGDAGHAHDGFQDGEYGAASSHRPEPYRRARAGDPGPGGPRHGRATPGPPRRRTGWTVVLVVVVVLALGVGGVLLARRQLTPPPQAAVGDCVQVTSQPGHDPDVRPLACSSPKAVFKVAKRLDAASADCPHGDYAQFAQTGGGSGMKLCLMLNAHRGDCFDHLDRASLATHVSCAGAETKVVKIAAGKATPKACRHTKADHVLMYADPATTICTRKP